MVKKMGFPDGGFLSNPLLLKGLIRWVAIFVNSSALVSL